MIASSSTERKYDSALPVIGEFLSTEINSSDGLMVRALLYDRLEKYEMARADYARVTDVTVHGSYWSWNHHEVVQSLVMAGIVSIVRTVPSRFKNDLQFVHDVGGFHQSPSIKQVLKSIRLNRCHCAPVYFIERHEVSDNQCNAR